MTIVRHIYMYVHPVRNLRRAIALPLLSRQNSTTP